VAGARNWQIGEIGRDGQPKRTDIARRPLDTELESAFETARAAGRWRFDERCTPRAIAMPWSVVLSADL